jgi:phenylacetate-CoA ligase
MHVKNLERLRRRCEVRAVAIAEVEKALRCTRVQLDRQLLQRLNDALVYAWSHSPFYINRFKDKTIPERVKHIARGSVGAFQQVRPTSSSWDGDGAWGAIPFTTKEDLREGYPSRFLAVPWSRVTRYGESTGSSGAPTSAFMTEQDWERGSIWLELSLLERFDAQDVVFIAVPYELSFAAPDLDGAFRNVGAAVVAVGSLNSVCPWSRTLEMIHVLKPSVLVCTPTRALRLFDMCLEAGKVPSEVGLRSILYVGEACSPAKLAKLAAAWGVSLTTAYGATETNALALPCRYDRLHLLEHRFFFEVIDPNTHAAVEDGCLGELAVTTLGHEAMPLIRYRTGDAVVVDREPCPCGLGFRTIRHLGRLSDALPVDGHSLLKAELENVVLGVPGTGVYCVCGVTSGRLEVFVQMTGDERVVADAVASEIATRFRVPAAVRRLDTCDVGRLMDSMLKPGGVSFEQVREARECVR